MRLEAQPVLPPGPAGDSVGRGRPARPLADAPRRTEEVPDPGEASREAGKKRALPVVVCVAAALVAWAVVRRARR
jgi:hypothetical protein